MKRTKGDLLSNTNNVKNSKFIDNNTLLIEYDNGTKAIRLHDTDVITFDGNKTILNSGGWRTATTKERINNYSKLPVRINQNKGLWYITGSLFYDGITFDMNGKLLTEHKDDDLKAVAKIKKQISNFCKLITPENLPVPNSGDCWYCSMRTEKGITMGDASKDYSHLQSHIDEGYLHGSLLVNAMREKGYSDEQIGFHYHLKLADTFKRAVYVYLVKRLIKNIAL